MIMEKAQIICPYCYEDIGFQLAHVANCKRRMGKEYLSLILKKINQGESPQTCDATDDQSENRTLTPKN